MKRILSLFVCLAVLLCSLSVGVCAAETTPADPTETNTGSAAGDAFFIFALIVVIAGGIYLFFMLKK